MAQELSVPPLASVLSEQSFQGWGVIQSQNGMCLELIISCSLPVRTPISIQTSSDLFLGHVVARELESVCNSGLNLNYGIYQYQCLPQGRCAFSELTDLMKAPASQDHATKVDASPRETVCNCFDTIERVVDRQVSE
jgi:hypothetical protein